MDKHRATLQCASLLSLIIDVTRFVLCTCGMYGVESQCLVLLSHSNINWLIWEKKEQQRSGRDETRARVLLRVVSRH